MVREVQYRPRIAVIDDERPYALASAFALGDEFDVVPMTSARELIDEIERGGRFDLILSDLRMPETNGVQMFRALWLLVPAQAKRVFFVTALLDDSVPPELRGRFLRKPSTADDLTRLVEEKLAECGRR